MGKKRTTIGFYREFGKTKPVTAKTKRKIASVLKNAMSDCKTCPFEMSKHYEDRSGCMLIGAVSEQEFDEICQNPQMKAPRHAARGKMMFK